MYKVYVKEMGWTPAKDTPTGMCSCFPVLLRIIIHTQCCTAVLSRICMQASYFLHFEKVLELELKAKNSGVKDPLGRPPEVQGRAQKNEVAW